MDLERMGRGPRPAGAEDLTARRKSDLQAERSRSSTSSAGAAAQKPDEAPEPGSLLGSASAERGQTRDAAAENQTRDQIARMTERLQDLAHVAKLASDTELSIEVDSDAARFVVRDKESGEVLRKIPEDEANKLLDQLGDSSGFVIDRQT